MIDNFDPRQTPWLQHDVDFYELESFRDQADLLLRYAVLAPSSHNTQPWIFRITDGGVEVFADYSRRLNLVDPDDRELLISVGAAITNLRVAAAWFGFETTVMYETRPEESLPVAFVSFRETSSTDEELRSLFPAIRRRHTNRTPFTNEPMDSDAVSAICALIDRYPETLRIILSQDHPTISHLVAEGDRQLLGRAAVREELAGWMRPSDGEQCDGICVDSSGINAPYVMTDWVLRNVNVADVQARRDSRLVENAALVILTSDDDRTSLIGAGELLERFLLTITLHGVQCSFLNQPVEVPELRKNLQEVARTNRPPQLLLRIGYAKDSVRPAPRRPVEDVIEGARGK